MQEDHDKLLRDRLTEDHYQKLTALANPNVLRYVADAVTLCDPSDVQIYTDSEEDRLHCREQALAQGEETPLATPGHTVHFDGPSDQGRDRAATKYLVPADQTLAPTLNQIERQEGLAEVRGIMQGCMQGRTMIVRFMSLGPTGSVFSVPVLECTDSAYVSHSLNLLYRRGYEQFKGIGADGEFFAVLHSAGKTNERMVSTEIDKRRIYIDHTVNEVYSVNTQYAGNTVGLKKLALRLTIRKADREGWLAEHMLLMGAHGPGGRKTYLAGAFPSACGKTSTAMLPGETILGDDIAYFRAIDGEARAVNAENGIFGIIQNVTAEDDPAIWDVLTSPGEVTFSNILVNDSRPYWLGMGQELPADGQNFSGAWHAGKTDAKGAEVPAAHKNARYAVALEALGNCDPELANPDGVPLSGIMYGGRDGKAYVPVQQSFDWEHGIVAYGAALETETTFATIGEEGVPEINLMSIQDFVSVSLGRYVANNLNFAKGLSRVPLVFGVNYFLRDAEGKFVNGIRDKHVWVKWMELRVHGDVGALTGPTGSIPAYDDLKALFRQVLDKDYAIADYVEQFTIRVPENLAKIDRVEAFHRDEIGDSPQVVFEVLDAQRQRLLAAQEELGDYISPMDLPRE